MKVFFLKKTNTLVTLRYRSLLKININFFTSGLYVSSFKK